MKTFSWGWGVTVMGAIATCVSVVAQQVPEGVGRGMLFGILVWLAFVVGQKTEAP